MHNDGTEGEPLEGDEITVVYPPTVEAVGEFLEIAVSVFAMTRDQGEGSPELTLAQRKVQEARFWLGQHMGGGDT